MNLFVIVVNILSMLFITNEDPGDKQTLSVEARVQEEKKWQLVFEDDFSQNAVDQSVWNMYHSIGHDGNGLRRPETISIEDGLLVITAQMKDGQLVSGGMAHRQNYTYGKFEFRVRTEVDSSKATSGVVLTWPQSEKWPEDGENDIYETGTGVSRNPFHTFIHYDKTNKQYHFAHQADAAEWQLVAMEWEPDELRIYRNGELVWTLRDKKAIPQVPHHICLQLDAFKKEMTGRVKLYVDWVKIYQKTK